MVFGAPQLSYNIPAYVVVDRRTVYKSCNVRNTHLAAVFGGSARSDDNIDMVLHTPFQEKIKRYKKRSEKLIQSVFVFALRLSVFKDKMQFGFSPSVKIKDVFGGDVFTLEI